MGVSYIPGPEQLLAPAAAQIAEGLQKYLQPQKEFQQRMQQAIGQNPALMGQLADVEYEAPGTLQRLGFGALGVTIASLPPSPQKQFQVQNREKIVRGATAKLEADTAEAEDAPEKLERDKAEHTQRMQSGEQSIRRGAQVLETGAIELDFAKRRQALVRTLPDLGTIDFYDEARKFMGGKLNGEKTAAFFASDETRLPFVDALNALQRERDRAVTVTMENNRRADADGDKVAARRSQNAFLAFQRAGDAGTVETWEQYLYDPAKQERARGLADGTIKPEANNFQDLMLKEVGTAAVRLNVRQFNAPLLRINDEIASRLATIRKGELDAPGIEENFSQLNQLFGQRAELGGGQRIKAVAARSGLFGRGTKATFQDANGRALDEDEVVGMIAAPPGSDDGPPAAMSEAAQIVVERINAMPDARRRAALNAFKLQDQSPGKADSRAVEAQLFGSNR